MGEFYLFHLFPFTPDFLLGKFQVFWDVFVFFFQGGGCQVGILYKSQFDTGPNCQLVFSMKSQFDTRSFSCLATYASFGQNPTKFSACQVATCKKWQSVVWPWRLAEKGQQDPGCRLGPKGLRFIPQDWGYFEGPKALGPWRVQWYQWSLGWLILAKETESDFLYSKDLNMIPEPLPTGYRRIYFIVG